MTQHVNPMIKVAGMLLLGLLLGKSCSYILHEDEKTAIKMNARIAECESKGGHYDYRISSCVPIIPLKTE
jgi:hypothetical protein